MSRGHEGRPTAHTDRRVRRDLRDAPQGRCVAETRYRDLDGRLRKVTATAGSERVATARLKERLAGRTGYTIGNLLEPSSSFQKLCDLWLADLELRDLAASTKEGYQTRLRLHVRPAFEHYTLAEITTGRVEWFLAEQAKVSPSHAKQTRTLLNLLFGYALRHDALTRNPVEGTSQLRGEGLCRVRPSGRLNHSDDLRRRHRHM